MGHSPGMAWRDIAHSAYLSFLNCAGGGGLYPPTWEALHESERAAWEAAARQSFQLAQSGTHRDRPGQLNEQRWHGWAPPGV